MATPEYPPQDYFLGWRLRLTLRFDEFGSSRLQPAPTVLSKNLDGVKVPRTDLQVQPDPAAPAGVHRLILLAPGTSAAPSPTDQARSTDGLTFDVTLVPSQMEWQQNGLRTADTLHATFRYVDAPIDARLVRAVAVEAVIGTVKGADFKAGIGGQKGSGGDLQSLVQDTYVDDKGQQRTNSRFLGWVDKWEIEWSEDDEPLVHIECRDNTQLFVEQAAPPKLVLDMTKPIDEAVAQYLSHFNQMQGISIEYRPSTDTPPVLKSVLQNTAFRPQLGPPPAKGGGGAEKTTVWDYLTDVCGAIGHGIRVDGTNVVIQRTRSLMSNQVTRRTDDPFQGRDLPTGVHLDYRRFIYGRNISSMKMSRNFTKNQVGNIECRCYSTEAKTVLAARFPLPADRQKFAIPGNAQPDQKWTVIRVSGINDVKTLRAIAQEAYEQLGRSEFQVEVKTYNLSSYGGGNTDPDILDMKPGDSFEVLVNRDSQEAATLTRIEQLLSSQAQSQAFMKSLGFADDFSSAYAKAYTDAGFLTVFRLKGMKVACDVDDGIDITLNGVNYVEVRADKLLPQGEEPGSTATGTENQPRDVSQGG